MCLRLTLYQVPRLILSDDCLWPDPEKVKAVVKAPPTANREQLESFFKVVEYYACHLPNLSLLAGPLNELHITKVRFENTERCLSAYEEIKKELAGQRVLTSSNKSSILYLAIDATKY